MDNHFHQFLSRWQQVDTKAAHCVDCHTSHTAGSASEGYLSRDTVTAVCEACHRVIGENE